MKLKTKIDLARLFALNPEQILFLENIELHLDEMSSDFDYVVSILDEKLDELQNLNDEGNCLNLAYIISIVEKNKTERDSFGYDNYDLNNNIDENIINEKEEEEEFSEFFDKIGGLSAKEQRKLQKEAVAKYKGLEKKTIIADFKNYVLKKYPQIINGFDRSIYRNAKIAYWDKENIFNLWEIPTKLYEKIKEAEHEVEEMLKEDVLKNAEKMYPIWKEKYLLWLKKNGLTKATKVNIKDFFRSIKVKPSETIVERLKENYNQK